MIDLYSHNQKAYSQAKLLFSKNNSVCIIHPTGTGKSLIIGKFIEENPKAKFLFIAPSTFIFSELKKHLNKQDYNVDYKTYSFLLHNDIEKLINYDFIFIDEFHRAGAEQWSGKILQLKTINPQAKILGTTATHIRYLDNNRDMAQELFNNNIASYLDLGTAISKKIHKKPYYVSAVYNVNEILDKLKTSLKERKREKELNRLQSKRIVWEESKGVDVIIKKHLTTDRKRILVFCKNIAHISRVIKLIKPTLLELYNSNIEIHSIHSGAGYDKRKKVFKQFSFSDVPQVLFSVDMFNEGIHIKGVDTVMMFRDTTSPILFFQQIGRGFTVNQQSQPLIFDFVNNFKIKNSVDNLENFLHHNFNGESNKNQRNKKSYIVDFHDETIDLNQFIDGFTKNQQEEAWMENFNYLKGFYEEHKRFPYRKEFSWFSHQREYYRDGNLPQWKIDLFLSLSDEIFKLYRASNTWEENVLELKRFISEKGRIPYSRESQFLHKLKHYYSKGILENEKIEEIKAINPKLLETREEYFMKKLIEVENFVKKNKRVPKGTENRWVGTQRTKFNNGKLSKEHIELMLTVHKDILKTR